MSVPARRAKTPPVWVSRLDSWTYTRGYPIVVGRVRDIAVMFLLWIVLLCVSGSAFATIANSLPRVVPFEDRTALGVTFFVGALFTSIPVLLVTSMLGPNTSKRLPHAARRRRALHVVQRLARLSRRLLRDVLGLIFTGPRQAALAILLGIVAAGVAYGVANLLAMSPELVATVPPTDARFEAIAQAPGWVRASFFAIYAPVPEEIMYRSAVLVAAAIASAWIRTPWIRVLIVGTTLLATSYLFGAAHARWSLLNAVDAGITGVLYGSVTLLARSLWAGIIAHAIYNVLIVIA